MEAEAAAEGGCRSAPSHHFYGLSEPEDAHGGGHVVLSMQYMRDSTTRVSRPPPGASPGA